jgi:nicotinamide riboside kinase
MVTMIIGAIGIGVGSVAASVASVIRQRDQLKFGRDVMAKTGRPEDLLYAAEYARAMRGAPSTPHAWLAAMAKVGEQLHTAMTLLGPNISRPGPERPEPKDPPTAA